MNRRPFKNLWLDYTVLELIIGAVCIAACAVAVFALGVQI